MMYNKVCAAFIMCISVALTLTSNQAFAQSGAERGAHGGVPASTHSIFRSHHPHNQHIQHNRRNAFFQHNRRNAFFPATGGFFLGPLNGVPDVEVTQPMGLVPGDFTYTYKYDVPWDWAHRYPPSFFADPAEPPAPPVSYRPGCAAQTVTVPGADGKDQTITMVRC
jgi:hypothetical protein